MGWISDRWVESLEDSAPPGSLNPAVPESGRLWGMMDRGSRPFWVDSRQPAHLDENHGGIIGTVGRSIQSQGSGRKAASRYALNSPRAGKAEDHGG